MRKLAGMTGLRPGLGQVVRAGTLAAAVMALPAEAGAQAMDNAAEIAVNVRSGHVKARDVVEAALDRAKETADLHAFITIDASRRGFGG